MKKINNLFILIVFVLIIYLPLILSDKVGGKVSENENRVLATFPNILVGSGLRSGFESWINDNIGFREQAIQLNTYIRYNIFNTDPTSDTLRGKDGWLFYYTADIIKDFQHLNIPDKKKLNEQMRGYKALKEYLDKQNIPLLVVLIPDKKTVYPEYYPSGILQTKNESRSSVIEQEFKNSGFDFLYLLPELLDAKKDNHVYYSKIDNAHWNSYGKFIGYKAIMERVKKYFPDIKTLNFNDFSINMDKRSGNIGGIEVEELEHYFMPKYIPSAELSGDDYWKDKSLLYEHIRYKNINDELPKLLIIGDSYFYLEPTLSFFAESFSETVFIHNHESNKISDYVNIVQPDIVIYETVERMFDGSSSAISDWADIVFPNLTIQVSEEVTTAVLSFPEKDCVQEMYNGMILDYVNGRNVKEQGKIDVLKSDNTLTLVGWAADFGSKLPAGALYVKAGKELYEANYGISRTSVSEYYNNPDLENTGFEITLPSSVLQEEKISFIIISNDGLYRYREIPYTLTIK